MTLPDEGTAILQPQDPTLRALLVVTSGEDYNRRKDAIIQGFFLVANLDDEYNARIKSKAIFFRTVFDEFMNTTPNSFADWWNRVWFGPAQWHAFKSYLRLNRGIKSVDTQG